MQLTSIYPMQIKGSFRKIKNYFSYLLFVIYFGSSWIRWQRVPGLPDQAILVDLPNRKGYFFGIEIWPDEVYYITAILICAALGLFFITSLFGRIWCGFSCPHTVFVDLFIKVEHFFQGDRNARIKLDAQPSNPAKFKLKLATHIVWLIISFAFAFGWVCYFYNGPTLIHDLGTFNVTPGGTAWLLGLTGSTYLFAGFVRENVCTHMCPYGRFQSAMLDRDTKVITYHDWRGELRGKSGPGDCIDCDKCVHVCPMGIDIRDGLQMKCIGCGLCVDACNTVMDKLGRARNLIGYESINSTKYLKKNLPFKNHVLRTKTILFLIVFSIVCGLTIYSLNSREPFEVNVLRDRGVLFTTLPDGSIRNIYTIKVFNRKSVERNLKLSISGAEDVKFMIHNKQSSYGNDFDFRLPLEQESIFDIFVKTTPQQLTSQNTIQEFPITITITDLDSGETAIQKELFILSK